MSDRISVALTTYNGDKYLKEQLDSLYSQSRIPDEIIVVDDCSTDSSPVILEEYHLSKGLIYYINEYNLGVNKNFEKAISLCTGDYVALCDQDDIWHPSKIEKCFQKLKEIEKNGLPSLVTSGKIDVDANMRILSMPKRGIDSDQYYISLLGHYMQGSSMMLNRSLISHILPLPDNQNVMYDVYIGLLATMIGNKYNIAEPLMYHRHHSNNVTAKNVTQSLVRRIIKLHEKYYPFYSRGRCINMMYLADRKSSIFIPERIYLYNSILAISKENNLVRKIMGIKSIRILKIHQRMIAILYTIIWTIKTDFR